MQNFIKTIINGVQKWTKKEIKKSTADWNQNDENADNYVKNRTHWEEKEKTTLVDNLTFSDYDSGNAPKCNFVPGQKYDVIWNGVLYEGLVCSFDDNYNVIASLDNGYPFYIDDDGGNGLYIEAGDNNWVVSIIESNTVVHKLDHKYLPDDIGVQPDWNEENENSKAYIRNKPDVALQSDLETTNANVNTANSNIATLQSDMTTAKNNITAINGDLINLRNAVNAPKDYIVLKDISNGYNYRIEMQDGNLISSLTGTLDDFTYTTRSDGTIVINGWKQTFYGEPSTEMIVPDNVVI